MRINTTARRLTDPTRHQCVMGHHHHLTIPLHVIPTRPRYGFSIACGLLPLLGRRGGKPPRPPPQPPSSGAVLRVVGMLVVVVVFVGFPR